MGKVSTRRLYLPDNPVWQSVAIGVFVFVACLAGIATRLLFDLASFWPPNAILFCILVFRPKTNRPLTWIAAIVGYALADAIAGSNLLNILALNAANLVGVAAGVVMCKAMPRDVLRLHKPIDAIIVMLVVSVASIVTAILGAAVGPMLFGMSIPEGLALWFSSEFVNYALIFPIMAALVSRDDDKFRLISRNQSVAVQQFGSLAFLIVSYAVMLTAGGPGALTYVLPSLGWIAIRFRPLTTAIISLIVCAGLLISGQNGLLPLQFDMDQVYNASSFRFGVAMVSVMTFAISTLNAAWRRVHIDLQVTSSHDALTGLLNRAAFNERANALLQHPPNGRTFTLLMMDIDHFKLINDRFGHPAGDLVLAVVARTLADGLRSNDVIGRIGGEEFAVILHGTNLSQAETPAERLRRAVEETRVTLPDNTVVQVTISIGGAESRPQAELTDLMSSADRALYTAKNSGRNKVEIRQNAVESSAS